MALLTKDDIRTEMNVEDDSVERDDFIDVLIPAVANVFEEIANRTLEEATFTEYYSGEKMQNKLLLGNYPVISITTLHDDPDWNYDSGALINSSDYTFNAEKGILYYNGAFYNSDNNIKVVYVAGYGDTVPLPLGLKQVLVRQVCHWHDQGKDKIWGVSSISNPVGGGAVQAYSQLKSNMLPDFALVAQMFKKVR